MAKVPLIGGAYEAKSVIADAQRCLNLYPEKNPEGAAAPYTHYPTPGTVKRAQGPVSPVRGLYTATNGKLYAVVGNNVYYINASWALTLLGTMSGALTTPVAMQDNGTTLVIVDGSISGYQVNITTNAFTAWVDPAFYGSNSAQYLDSFMIFNHPNTKQFYTTLSNTLALDALYFAQKTSAPDLLATLIVKHREIWLLGQKTTEVWYNAGSPSFPFASLPSTFLDQGCAAVYSVAKDGEGIYFLSRNSRGQATLIRTKGYEGIKVSTYALEAEWAKYSTIEDAIGYTYTFGGHAFYVLTFPTADKTWVFDVGEGLWHQRGWMDSDGEIHRHRGNCFSFAYGKLLVGDFENGAIYSLEDEVYTDSGDEAILRLRSFPHLGMDGKRVSYSQFIADMEVGTQDNGTLDNPAYVFLRWSDDRGQSYGEPVPQSLGATGQFLTNIQWRRLGLARDRVFELSWSTPVKTALNGAYVEAMVLGT